MCGLTSGHSWRLRGSDLGRYRTKLAFVDGACHFWVDVSRLGADDAVVRLTDPSQGFHFIRGAV